MHEFVMSLEDLKKKAGVSAMDIAKGLLDNGIHPPTMYFPLIVHEALMVEPTETESKEVLDHAIEVFRKLYNDALENPESLLQQDIRYLSIILRYNFRSNVNKSERYYLKIG